MKRLVILLAVAFLSFSIIAYAGVNVKFLEMAADADDTTAQLLLADYYMNGKEVTPDFDKSIYWLKRAVELGDQDAKFKLAALYKTGKVVSRDLDVSCPLYYDLGKSGDHNAQFEIAECINNGYEFDDSQSAMAWYRKAAKGGHEKSKIVVDEYKEVKKLLGALRTPALSLWVVGENARRAKRFLSSVSTAYIPEIEKALQQYIENYALPLGKKHLEAIKGVHINNYAELIELNRKFKNIESDLPKHYIQPTILLAENSLQAQEDALKKQYADLYEQEVKSLSNPKAALQNSVIFEKRARSEFGDFYQHIKFRTLISDREKHRQQLYRLASQDLHDMLNSAQSAQSLKEILKNYTWQSDAVTPSLTNLRNTYEERLTFYHPFQGLHAAAYLNAIYGGEWQSARDIDKKHMEAYQESLGEYFGMMGGALDFLFQMKGVESNFKDYFTNFLKNGSLIVPMFAIYLVDYQGVYYQCLERDAIPFTITTTSETIYRDSWGNDQTIKHPDQVEHIIVNRRFAGIFNDVGLNEPDSFLGTVIEQLMFGGDKERMSMAELVTGTRQYMKNYPCESAISQKMEKQMMSYFEMYKSEFTSLR